MADHDDARQCQGGTVSVAVNGSGRASLVATVQAGTVPAQDGQLVSQGDEFEFQRSAAAQPEREQGTEGGQKRKHVDDGMTMARKRSFPGLLEP